MQDFTIYRDDKLETSFVRKQKALAFRKALLSHIQAVSGAIERAIGECVLYSENKALYHEYCEQRKAAKTANLRSLYF